MKKKKQKKPMKKRIKDFMNTLKPILILSIIINLVLLGYTYYLKTHHHTYLFMGNDEYISVNNGVININYDVNLLEGNNIRYINEKDYKIDEIKIGYYVKENNKLKELTSYSEKFKESVSLKDTINNLKKFNISEVAKTSKMFKGIKDINLETNLYLTMETKTKDGDTLKSNILLDVSKIY